MTFMEFYAVVIVGVLLTGTCTMRLSNWSRQESGYWFNVALKTRMKPELNEYYKPLLKLTQMTRPNVLRRIVGWKNPELRAKELKA